MSEPTLARLEVMKNALISIVDTMGLTIERSARSVVAQETLDFSTALFDADGQQVVQGLSVPVHLGSTPDAVAAAMEKFRGDLGPGDIVVLNDPYQGGTHLPDVILIKPVFYRARLSAFLAILAHQTDMGGLVAGSNSSEATEIFQEGLRLPPIKLFEKGVPNNGVFDIISANVRTPEEVRGDIVCAVSALNRGERDFIALLDKYGDHTIRTYMQQLLDYTERMTRAEISSLAEGLYQFADFTDDDGVSDTPLKVQVNLRIQKGSVEVDLTGSSEQARIAINSNMPSLKSAVYFVVKAVLGADIPPNAGFFRAITVTAPLGTMVNPRFPAPVAARLLSGFRIIDALFGAFYQAAPHRVAAAGDGGANGFMLYGRRDDGSPFVISEWIVSGWGGSPTLDGLEGACTRGANIRNTPVEVVEAYYPLMIQRYGFVPDTAGAGKYRGALATTREWKFTGEEAQLHMRVHRHKFAPFGLGEGKCGTTSSIVLNPGPEQQVMPNKFTRRISNGTVICHVTAGGGGYGDPLERDPDLVLEDIRDEKITPEYAEREHGVVIDKSRLVVDWNQTREKRRELIEKRP